MMNNSIFFQIAVIFFVILTLNSCNSGVLDVDPRSTISEKNVWNDPDLAQQYLNDIYYGMRYGLGDPLLGSITDEAHDIHNQGTQTVVDGSIAPGDMGVFDWGNKFDQYEWPDLYFRIRQTNNFISRIDEVPADEELKNKLKGEAHFLRAYFYHNLMRMYGGVPIIKRVYELDDDFIVARNSFAETIDLIKADADTAASLLPIEQTQLGRATKGAALALKSRVLLYAASDLYHRNPSDMPETGYTNEQNQQELWRAAKNAAEEVINMGEYHLYQGEIDSAAQRYSKLFLTKNNDEKILSRYFVAGKEDGEYSPGLKHGPNGYHSWGGSTPIQNLVDDYEMNDGSKFNWDDSQQASNPYENRDPRFYATILYNGAKWMERPEDVREFDPQGVIETATFETEDGGERAGLDTRESPIENWNGTYSGYYLRKFIDPDVNPWENQQEVPWPFFRYGEILLNYAEASIELGEEQDARWAINKIRNRVNMPPVSDTGQELMERYRNERRIELAFENHRYFDVRRWMIAPEVLNENARGIDIYAHLNNDDSYTYEYNVTDIQERSWNDKMYFLPIPEDEMNSNQELAQNPGY